MNIKTIFRLILCAELVFLVLTAIAWWLLKPTLPPELGAYQDRWLQSDFSIVDIIAALLMLLYLAGWIGMLRLRPTGRTLYLTATVLMLLITPFSGPTVLDPWTAFCAGVSGLCGGMALAMAYFSELRQQFVPPPPVGPIIG